MFIISHREVVFLCLKFKDRHWTAFVVSGRYRVSDRIRWILLNRIINLNIEPFICKHYIALSLMAIMKIISDWFDDVINTDTRNSSVFLHSHYRTIKRYLIMFTFAITLLSKFSLLSSFIDLLIEIINFIVVLIQYGYI